MASRTLIWTGAYNGDFDNALNWDDVFNNLDPAASPPTSVDSVSFYSSSSEGTVDLDGGNAGGLQVFGSGIWTFTGSLTLGGQSVPPVNPYGFSIGSTVTLSDVTLNSSAGTGDVGSSGSAAVLTVEGGSTVTTLGMTLGNLSGETGTLILTGTGTTWHDISNAELEQPGNSSGYLLIGFANPEASFSGGVGYLTVTAGAALTEDSDAIIGVLGGSIGTATVSAAGTWTIGSGLTVGDDGTGTLTVGTGTGTSAVAVDGGIEVGQNPDSVGTLAIDAGGTVKDTEAAESNNYLMQIGDLGVGAVTVTGASALLDMNGSPLSIGFGEGGQGSLTVSDGGTVTVGTANGNTGDSALSVGRSGTGQITVTGAGSTLTTAGYVVVGRAGTGTVLLENSGSLTIGVDPVNEAGLSIGDGNSTTLFGIGGSGSVTVTSGAVLTSAQNINVGGDGVDGALNVNDSGIVDIGTELVVGYAAQIFGVTYGGNGNVAIGAGGTVQVTGTPQTTYDAVYIGAQQSAATKLASTGEISVSGTGALLNTNGGGISVGSAGIGILSVSQGATVVAGTPNSGDFSALSVGGQGQGSVSVSGSGSSLTAKGFVFFGRQGQGSLLVQNSATMTVGQDPLGTGGLSFGGSTTNATAATAVYIGGDGSGVVTANGYVYSQQNVYVGSTGATGTLSISNGGTVEAAQRIEIGNTATLAAGGQAISASGTTTVASATSYAGYGIINVGPGGTLKTDGTEPNGTSSIVVGNGIGSTGALNVSGVGALATTNGNRLTIGGSGDGTLLVGQGGAVQASSANYTDTEAAMYVGFATGSTGAVTVTDSGSNLSVTGLMDVGLAGTGSLLVEDRGAVTATSLDSAADTGSTGVITDTGTGSQLTVSDQFTIGDTGSAELSIMNGATATVGDMDIGLSAGGTGNVDLEGASALLHVTGDLHVGDAGSAVLTIGAGTELTVDGDLFTGTQARIVGLGGTIDPKHYYNTTTTTGPLTVVASVAIVNTGTFIAENGLLELNGPVADTGVMQIQDGGVLQLDQSVVATQTVQFTTAGGTLDIKDPTDFAPIISGYTTGDTVQVYGIGGQPAPTYSYSGGNTVLTYNNGITLTFAGTFGSGTITVDADPTPPPCFLIGTRIATVRGEVAVENLRIGDCVLTAAGRTRPVCWIGTRSLDPARHPGPASVLPVRVRRDSFGYGAPRRDLYLSPDHAVFVEDVLIPVKYLINGRTVLQLQDFGEITYFHVELDRHDVLLAEGLTVESYLETGTHAAFENGGAPMLPHPDFGERIWEAQGYAPLVITGPKLDAAVRLLASEEAVAPDRRRLPRRVLPHVERRWPETARVRYAGAVQAPAN